MFLPSICAAPIHLFLLVVGVPNLRHGSASSLEYTQQPLEHCGDIIAHKGNPIFEPDMSL